MACKNWRSTETEAKFMQACNIEQVSGDGVYNKKGGA